MENNNFVQAKVIYKDIDNNNKPVYSQKISNKLNSIVDLSQYKRYIPSGYKFAGYGEFNQHLKNHDIDVIYVKESTSRGKIITDYIADNQLINHTTFTGNVGDSFNINQCRRDVPHNYKFVKILTGSRINVFKVDSQIIIVKVAKIHFAKITIEYLCNGQLISKDQVKCALGANFDINQYTHNLPVGYKFVKLDGSVPKKVQHNQTITVEMTKRVPSKVSMRMNNQNSNHQHESRHLSSHNEHNSVSNDPRDVGEILMKLASSLHALGLTISKSHKL